MDIAQSKKIINKKDNKYVIFIILYYQIESEKKKKITQIEEIISFIIFIYMKKCSNKSWF